MPDTVKELKEEEVLRVSAEETNEKDDHAWLVGAILIGLGLLFLADQFLNIRLVDNWWALFILIPAFSNLNRARLQYQAAGRWTHSARSALVGGLLISMIAVIFLFNLSWTLFWPTLLIILGVGLLLRAM